MSVRLWGGDPGLEIMLQGTEASPDELDPYDPNVKVCREWLEAAHKGLSERLLGFIPYHAYDRIWAAFNRIRHRLCRILDPVVLQPVVVQARDCIDYLSGEEHRRKVGGEIDAIDNINGVKFLMLTKGSLPGK